jgi:hypothetical protein
LEIERYVAPPLKDPQLFIHPLCNIGDIEGITSRTNGLVYISTSSDSTKDKYAMVITNLNTLSSPGIVYEYYVRSSTTSKFYIVWATEYSLISISSIQGSSSAGYYISKSDYNNTTSTSITVPTNYKYAFQRGFTYALQDSKCISSMADYYPSNWKRMSDVSSLFYF